MWSTERYCCVTSCYLDGQLSHNVRYYCPWVHSRNSLLHADHSQMGGHSSCPEVDKYFSANSITTSLSEIRGVLTYSKGTKMQRFYSTNRCWKWSWETLTPINPKEKTSIFSCLQTPSSLQVRFPKHLVFTSWLYIWDVLELLLASKHAFVIRLTDRRLKLNFYIKSSCLLYFL